MSTAAAKLKPLARVRVSALPREPLLVSGVTLGVLGLYLLLRAPVLDPANYLDPWIYTALFTNFHFVFHVFGWTYYASRLPWVIPGLAVHSVLPPLAAFFVLHVVFFVSGGLAAFLLIRRFYGSSIALVAYATLMLSAIFYDAYSNDYPDGALLTYLFAGALLWLCTPDASRRALRMCGAGFFLAAALGTNLFVGVLELGLLIPYAAVNGFEPRFLRRSTRDFVWIVIGGLALLLACGTFSRINGREFLFFLPQLRFASAVSISAWKVHGYSWIWKQGQLLLPPLVLITFVLAAGPSALRRLKIDLAARFAVGSVGFLLYFTTLIATWEFAFSGDLLELPYYYSLFNLPLSLAMAAVIYFIKDRAVGALGGQWYIAAVLAAGSPLVLVYGLHIGPTGASGALLTLVLAVVTASLVVSAGSMRWIGRLVALTAVVVFLFSLNYGAASGEQTKGVFINRAGEFQTRRDTLSLAMQLVHFMRDRGLQRDAPAFWYDARADVVLTGMQAMYLWADTWVGLNMPRVDNAMRQLLNQRRPTHIVLLCPKSACSDAPRALEQAGYPIRAAGATLLAAGAHRVWVRAFVLLHFSTKS